MYVGSSHKMPLLILEYLPVLETWKAITRDNAYISLLLVEAGKFPKFRAIMCLEFSNEIFALIFGKRGKNCCFFHQRK